MRVTICASEPTVLREVRIGQLFLPRDAHLCELVCVLFVRPELDVGELVNWRSTEHEAPVVVLGCRVGPGETGYLPPGRAVRIHLDTPVSLLEAEAPLQLRERRPDAPPPDSPPMRL